MSSIVRDQNTEITPYSIPVKVANQVYVPALDGIRAVAFLTVFVAHAGYDNRVPGGLGVTIFFFLSGYLITTLLRKEFSSTGTIDLRGFYIRRAYRILPPLYITLALAVGLSFLRFPIGRGNTAGWVSLFTYTYNYVDLITHSSAALPTGSGLVWSLMIEEHFYVFFPLLYLLTSRRHWTPRLQSAALLVVSALILIWRCVLVFVLHSKVTGLPRWTYSATDARLDSIALGCVLAIATNPWCGDVSEWLSKNIRWLAALGVLLLIATLLIREPLFRETLRYTLQSIALYPIFYFCVLHQGSRLTSWLSWRFLRWIGWISYATYLSHETLIFLLQRTLHLGNAKIAVIAFGATLTYGWLMRELVENPLRRIRRRHPKTVL